jgi:hypothetical protein
MMSLLLDYWKLPMLVFLQSPQMNNWQVGGDYSGNGPVHLALELH